MSREELARLLPLVEKPSRYIDGEWNAQRKDLDQAHRRIALLFPDLYEAGAAHPEFNRACQLINESPVLAADRFFCPAPDMEEKLKDAGLALMGIESGRSLRDFDLIVALIPDITLAPNMLTCLDCGGVPICARERKAGDPQLVCLLTDVCSPLPLAEFSDAVGLGEVEPLVDAVVRAAGQKDGFIEAIAAHGSFLVPGLESSAAVAAARIPDLDAAPSPCRPIVPFAQLEPDRAILEMRRGGGESALVPGKGPVRERSVERLVELGARLIFETGYEEIELTSGDRRPHSRLVELLEGLSSELNGMRVALRAETLAFEHLAEDEADALLETGQERVSLYPVSGCQRLRDLAGAAGESRLIAAAQRAGRFGFVGLSLHFVIGLPGETEEDIKQSAALAAALKEALRQALPGEKKGRLHVVAYLELFGPAPGTPFEREEQMPPEELSRRHDLFRASLSDKRVRVFCQPPHLAFARTCLNRAGDMAGDILRHLWDSGARVFISRAAQTWEAWDSAVGKAGLDACRLVCRRIPECEPLPWAGVFLTG
jgi:hypothetical protein